MLRHKLLVILGSVVVLLVATTAGALLLLQDVVRGLDHVNGQAMAAVDEVNSLSLHITRVQVALYHLQLRRTHHLDELIDLVESTRTLMDRVGKHYLTREQEGQSLFERIGRQIPTFERHVGALATSRDVDQALVHNQAALATSVALQRDILQLGQIVRAHARAEQDELASRFRWTVLGLTVVFLLVINISILVLLRMASMVVRPVERLVEASRQLAQGKFDHRVHLDQRDEFDELAQAYNDLAEQLAATEERRIEMIGQVARAMNHELRNATAIIELQLQLLSRKSNRDPALEKHLHQIHESLERTTRTVEALHRVRRIVLTDYTSGVKMLDLEQSVRDDNDTGEPEAEADAPGILEAS